MSSKPRHSDDVRWLDLALVDKQFADTWRHVIRINGKIRGKLLTAHRLWLERTPSGIITPVAGGSTLDDRRVQYVDWIDLARIELQRVLDEAP